MTLTNSWPFWKIRRKNKEQFSCIRYRHNLPSVYNLNLLPQCGVTLPEQFTMERHKSHVLYSLPGRACKPPLLVPASFCSTRQIKHHIIFKYIQYSPISISAHTFFLSSTAAYQIQNHKKSFSQNWEAKGVFWQAVVCFDNRWNKAGRSLDENNIPGSHRAYIDPEALISFLQTPIKASQIKRGEGRQETAEGQ